MVLQSRFGNIHASTSEKMTKCSTYRHASHKDGIVSKAEHNWKTRWHHTPWAV